MNSRVIKKVRQKLDCLQKHEFISNPSSKSDIYVMCLRNTSVRNLKVSRDHLSNKFISKYVHSCTFMKHLDALGCKAS